MRSGSATLVLIIILRVEITVAAARYNTSSRYPNIVINTVIYDQSYCSTHIVSTQFLTINSLVGSKLRKKNKNNRVLVNT